MRLPARVTVSDCTLREGEQAAEVSLGVEGKLRVARRLAEIGVRQLQAGYPGRSQSDFHAVRQIKSEKLPLIVEGVVQVFQDDWRQQIDRGLESGVDVLGMIYPSSGLRLTHVQRVSAVEMIERSVAAVEYAVAQSPSTLVKFAPTDTLRADFELLRRLYPAVEAAGAARVSVADTVGGAHPQAVRYLVGEVVAMVRVPVQVHCHDDFGLATACALAGVEGGASIVDATVNGLGERAGNASLEEVVTALAVLYGYDMGIRLEELRSLAVEVEELTGVRIPPGKSLVGHDAFAHKLDAHVAGVITHPSVYEAIPPERVGNSRRFPLGKHSGPAAIRAWLQALHIEADEGHVDELVTRVEAMAVTQKKALSESQLRGLVREVIG
jgi:2-isopropylmalate synthase